MTSYLALAIKFGAISSEDSFNPGFHSIAPIETLIPGLFVTRIGKVTSRR